MDANFRVALDAYVGNEGMDDGFFELIERECRTRTHATMSAVAALVDSETWQNIQNAVNAAQEFVDGNP